MASSQQTIFDFSLIDAPAKAANRPDMSAEEAPPKSSRKKKKEVAPALKVPAKRGRKPLKEASAEADLIDIPDDEILFRKQYYSMGEVSEMFRINPSLIRFWENQFEILQPKKNKKGDRFFRPVDIKNLHLIYHLLRQRKYTLEGAKDYLKSEDQNANKKFELIQSLQKIRNFLLEIKANL